MAAVLKAAVFALAIIAAEKRFTMADGAKEYNIKKFLTKNSVLLNMRTTHGTFNPCQWYQVENLGDSDVTVSAWIYIDNTKRTASGGHAKKWKFEGTDKMWSGDEGPDDDRDEKRLLYQDDDVTCGVLQYDEIYDSIGIEKRTYYELLVNKDHIRSVPNGCTDYYSKITENKKISENKEEDLKTCKFE
uniref:Lipocalin n=1 Tax=Rhipicephalus appendiculatus TaxID=34631 RepID=A0A131YU95_RHIAP